MKWVLVIGISLIALASLGRDVSATSSPITYVSIIASYSQDKSIDLGDYKTPEPKSEDPHLISIVTSSVSTT